MITGDQLLAHLIGDYVLQSDWMANEKTKKSVAALAHVLTYAVPFLFLSPSIWAMLVIVGTHFLIDRFRLARFVCWLKNFMAPARTVRSVMEPFTAAGGKTMFTEKIEVQTWRHKWRDCVATGYHKERPPWMAIWLMIIADNTMHILINGLALRYL